MFDTAVRPLTTLGVTVGVSCCTCRCRGSVSDCRQAVVPMVNISKVYMMRSLVFPSWLIKQKG